MEVIMMSSEKKCKTQTFVILYQSMFRIDMPSASYPHYDGLCLSFIWI